MAVSMQGQLASLALSLLFGVFLGVLYDGVRILLILLGAGGGGRTHARLALLRFPGLSPSLLFRPAGRVGGRLRLLLLFFADLLFVTLAGALFTAFVYWQSDGVFRFYLLLGTALGFSAYALSVGRLVLLSADTIAFFLRVLFLYLGLALLLPLRLLTRVLRRAGRWLVGRLTRLFLRLLGPLYPARLARRTRRRLRRLIVAAGRPQEP